MDITWTDRTDQSDNLLHGPEFDAVVAAVCCEAEAERVVSDELHRLAA